MKQAAMFLWVFAPAIGGCAHSLVLPQSFIPVPADQRQGYDVRAVSPDGVVLAVRAEQSPAGGSLEFWTQAARNELEGRGYKLEAKEDVRGDAGRAGRLLSFSTQREGAEFLYILALYVGPRDILTAQAGGKADLLKPMQAEIRKALLSAR